MNPLLFSSHGNNEEMPQIRKRESTPKQTNRSQVPCKNKPDGCKEGKEDQNARSFAGIEKLLY
jgi:hypothetical protein